MVMFVRTKTISGKEYAYQVKNVWTRKGARQKTVKYIGSVHRLKRKHDRGLSSFVARSDMQNYVQNSGKNMIVRDLVALELHNYGFNEKKARVWEMGKLTADLSKWNFLCGKKNAVLAMNDGFMYDGSVRRLLRFKTIGDEDEVAVKLANCFVNAGIKIEKEIFVQLFEKLFVQ